MIHLPSYLLGIATVLAADVATVLICWWLAERALWHEMDRPHKLPQPDSVNRDGLA